MEPITILIIDDGDDLLKFCQHFLPSSYCIIHVRTGKEGLRILKTRTVNLIILDKTFDQIDKGELLGDDAENEGLYLLKLIRQQHFELPVMMITAHADQISEKKALELGARNYSSWETLCGNIGYLKNVTDRLLAEG